MFTFSPMRTCINFSSLFSQTYFKRLSQLGLLAPFQTLLFKVHQNQIAKINVHLGRERLSPVRSIWNTRFVIWQSSRMGGPCYQGLYLSEATACVLRWGMAELQAGLYSWLSYCLAPHSSRSLGRLPIWVGVQAELHGQMELELQNGLCGCPCSVVMLPEWMELEAMLNSQVGIYIFAFLPGQVGRRGSIDATGY